MPDKPKPVYAFSGKDYQKLSFAVTSLMETQLGAISEPLTADEMTLLFAPYEHRKALKQVYQLEGPDEARGEIYLNLCSVRNSVDTTKPLFDDDERAKVVITNGVLRITFDRRDTHDGFVTPKPIFGEFSRPRETIEEGPDILSLRFCDQAEQLLYTTLRWGMVRFVLEELQNSIRTPQQVRYVWPAIQTLAKVAELEMDLTQPSSRAGLNARPSSACTPFLRATNDVVAHSVLMGVHPPYRDLYQRARIKVVKAVCSASGRNISVV